MTDNGKPDALDEAVLRLTSGVDSDNPQRSSIRKIDLDALKDVDEDRFEKIVARASKAYTDRKPWEISDPTLARFIDPIEDEEYEMNISDEDKKQVRTTRAITNPNKIAELLGFQRASEPQEPQTKE